MAPVDNNSIPCDVIAPNKNEKSYMKVMDKAFELPVVTSAYSGAAKIASPITSYVESSLSTVTPALQFGYFLLRSKVEESIIPRLPVGMPEKIHNNVSTVVGHVSTAVEKIDHIACMGIDQLTEKLPALKDETPELLETSMESTIKCITSSTNYVASFSVSQVALKIVDFELGFVEEAVKYTGVGSEGIVLGSIKKIHTTANTMRVEGNKLAGTEKAKKIEDSSILGALMEITGINFICSTFGITSNDANVEK